MIAELIGVGLFLVLDLAVLIKILFFSKKDEDGDE